MSVLRDPRALLLLALGLLHMAGDVFDVPAAKGLGAVSMASPAPKVFSAVRGLETYSTRFFLAWETESASERAELTSTLAARLRGPYNRRNVYGAALSYGPVLVSNPRTRPMLESVLGHALGGEAPLLAELGLGRDRRPESVVSIVYEPVAGTDLGGLPTRLAVDRTGRVEAEDPRASQAGEAP